MTQQEAEEVAAAIAGLPPEERAHCFQDHGAARAACDTVRQDHRAMWREACVIDLKHHNMSGYVVRLVAASDGRVCVMFEAGDAPPLDTLGG